MAGTATKTKQPTAIQHRLLKTRQLLDIEREMHDKTLAALAVAHDKLVRLELLMTSIEAAFQSLTGQTPSEYLDK